MKFHYNYNYKTKLLNSKNNKYVLYYHFNRIFN
jgi:hypothetical protein